MSALDKMVQDEERDLAQRCKDKLTLISARRGRAPTPEQEEFILDISNDVLSNSVPGSGKTSAAVDMLLIHVLCGVVPEDKITALSFTTAATGELKYRYIEAAEMMGKSRHRIDFSTIHAMCSDIMRTHYAKLGLRNYTKPTPLKYSEMTKLIISLGEEMNISVTKENVRQVKRAIDDLNGALIFDPRHIATRQSFVECKLTVSELTALRKELYYFDQQAGTVQQQDLLLYTLELLLKYPEIQEEQRAKRQLVLCDEFQDLTLLQIKLLDLISVRLVVIGDVDQQIYGWAGASPKIVEDFARVRPNYVEHHLTHSFRCGQEIVEAAKRVIRFNNPEIDYFKGLDGRESRVEISIHLDLEKISTGLKEDLIANDNRLSRSTLFLYRTNFSVIPLYEELFKRGIPARSDKFVKAYDIDIVKELVQLIKIAKEPKKYENFYILRKLIPEFASYDSLYDMPIVQIVQQNGVSLLELDYIYQDPYAGSKTIEMLSIVRGMLLRGDTVLDIFEYIWPIYDELYYEDNFYRYAMDAEYYIGLVKPVIAHKTFDQFINEEDEKEAEVFKWNKLRMGVRCYTMHSSKGLEADDVYILDAEEGSMPNEKRLARTVKLGCTLDAAVTVRNERSLLYVAITRAKYNVYIGYKVQLAGMLTGTNQYGELDRAYKIMSHDYKDVECFKELILED